MSVYKLFWDEFSSWYLEMVKPAYQQPIDKATYDATLGYFETLLKLLYPVAPHVTEEINEMIGNKTLIAESTWPEYDENHLVEDEVSIPVQILGKLKGVVKVARTASQEEVTDAILNGDLKSYFEGKTVVKVIYVPGKIVNFIVK